MPVYRRFGFIEKTRWKTEDGKDHPVGLLHVPVWSLERVKSVLNRRGVQVKGTVVLHSSEEFFCEIQLTPAGGFQFQFRPRTEEADPGGTK